MSDTEPCSYKPLYLPVNLSRRHFSVLSLFLPQAVMLPSAAYFSGFPSIPRAFLFTKIFSVSEWCLGLVHIGQPERTGEQSSYVLHSRRLLSVPPGQFTLTKEKSISLINLNLGCLHPVACVRSRWWGFIQSTQRYHRRLFLLLNITTCFGRMTIFREKYIS
jgi:hypothetical protein